MHKILKLLITSMLLVSLLFGSAFAVASEEYEKANTLYTLGLITGSGGDLMLEKKLTRAEAAMFILRMDGMERFVISNKASFGVTGFKDVKATAWYASPIGYAIKMNIMTGYSDGTMKPNNFVTEKEFIAMLMKSLGYGASDFSWNTVYGHAYDIGLLTETKYATQTVDEKNYLRKNVSAALYNAITTKLKDQDKRPIDNLIAIGQVSKTAALNVGLIKEDKVLTKIESTKSTSSTTVEITLNEEIGNFGPSQVLVSKTSNTASLLEITAVSLSGKKLTLTTAPQVDSETYSISLSNVEDADKNVTASLSDSFTGYKTPEIISNFFKIKKVEAVGKSVVNVFFTQPITLSSELQLYYEIQKDGVTYVEGSFNKMAVTKIKSVDNGVSLWLKEKDLVEGTKYTLKIKGDMTSKYGARLNSGDGESMVFTGVSTANPIPVLSTVQVVDGQFIDVEFTADMDTASALATANYSLKNTTKNITTTPVVAKINTDVIKGTKVVRLKFVSFITTDKYELTLSNIYDQFKINKIEPTTIPAYPAASFTQGFKLEAAAALDRGTLVLYFNRSLDQTTVATASITINNASINQKRFDPERPNEITLYLNSGGQLGSGTTHTVNVISGLEDYMDVPQAGTLTTTVGGPSTAPSTPSITEAMMISNNMVLVRFNNDVNASSAVASKFTLEYTESSTTKVKAATSASQVDARSIAVTFDTLDTNTNYTIKGTTISDYTNQYSIANTSGSVAKQ